MDIRKKPLYLDIFVFIMAWVSLMIMTTTYNRDGDDLVAEKINKPQIERTGGV